MPHQYRLTALIEREGDGYVALCPELDVASQGQTVEEARTNLTEAVELFFEARQPGRDHRSTARRGLRDPLRLAVG